MKFLIIFFFISCTGAPSYQGPKTDHFDGDTFKNRTPMTTTLFGYLWSRFTNKRYDWPKWIETKNKKLDEKFFGPDQISATFINHSSVLLNFGGTIILTDPIFANRASPFSFVGPKRVRNPGIKKEDLPKVDVVLLSHNHYDHFDIEFLKWISKRDNPLIISGLGNSLLLKQNEINNYHDLDWDQIKEINGLKIHFLYSQHWSGRGLFDRRKNLWGSFLIKSPLGSVYFAGDTGFSSHFEEQGNKYGPIDLSLIPIGAYEPRDFMAFSHLNPEDAVKAHIALKSKMTMGIHFGTFQLTNESIDRPRFDLNLAKAKYKIKENMFFVPEFGKTYLIKNKSGEKNGE